MVSPLEFIGAAEDTGLIVPLGLWVLHAACHQLKAWEASPERAHLQLAVNVSARQFGQGDFVRLIKQVLHTTGANPQRLKLELTESLVIANVQDTVMKMEALKALGVRFALDDFGTGQSSLAYLTTLPLDQLKIDQSFVRNIGLHARDAVVIDTIIGMANNLGLEVIAEGVETAAQRNFLLKHGCELFQGYLFAKPVPIDVFEETLSLAGHPPQAARASEAH
jgi:EAL domain-containing protein (putative c-di-GMP-specific phosphodiesterase class I)